MTAGIDVSVYEGTDPILTIAEEVFSAMIDGEPGLLRPWDGVRPATTDPVYAWVDVVGVHAGRVLLETERSTATDLTRVLLALEADEEVGDADFVDALGEVANVVGGNVKALVPDPGALTLPQVTHVRPQTPADTLVYELALDWRGSLVVISLWTL